MRLGLRFARAFALFGVIFASYLVQLALVRMLRRRARDASSGRVRTRIPAWLERRRARIDTKNARRLLRGMLRLRGVYIKLGQVLSIMGGFLPRAYTTELEALQDHVPPHPYDEVVRAFERSLGRRPEACFRSIEQAPIAAASLGQVHVAFLEDGRKVAVKILYPGIRDVIATDMSVLALIARILKRFVLFRHIERVHAALADLLRRETDYLHEADCMTRMAANFVGEPDILFPAVVAELTTRDVLTMTFMDGVKITRFDELERLGVDRRRLATRFVESFYKQLFVDRLFHADPHPGNFLVQAGEDGAPKIVVLDFGAVSEVAPNLIDGALEILQALMTQDGKLALVGFRRMGFVAPDGDEALLEKTVLTYFGRLLKIEDRSPAALMRARPKDLQRLADPGVEREQLRDLMRAFEYPDGWFYVERASVLAFWLCAQIEPGLDTMSVGLPYVLPLVMAKQAAAAAG